MADKIKENSLVIICSPNYWLPILENIHSKSEVYIKINNQEIKVIRVA